MSSSSGDDRYHAFMWQDVFTRVIKFQNACYSAILISFRKIIYKEVFFLFKLRPATLSKLLMCRWTVILALDKARMGGY
jgi:hypothetical protein